MRGRNNQVFKLNTSTMEMANSYVLTKRMKVALISLILCIFIPSYNYILNEILQFDLGMGSISNLSYIMLAIVGLYAYTYLSKISKGLVVLMALLLMALFISYLLYPDIKEAFISDDYNPLTSILLYVPLMGFPMMIYTNYLNKNIYIISEYIRFPSLALIALAIIDYYWTVLVNGHFFDVNYMSFSYAMLPGVCFSFYYGISKGKILDIIISIVGLIVILVVGSRGCFLCGVSFLAIACYKKYTVSFGKVLLSISLLTVSIIILAHFLPSFSDSVMTYMDEHGASSRTLLKISDGTIEESSTRDAIHKIMLTAVNEQPLGYGPMGDRYILNKHGNQGYAHSIIYEFLVDYGIILGPILLLVLLISILYKLKYFYKSDVFYCMAAFLAMGIIKLFVSGSYLEEPFFWGLVGLLFKKK